MLSIAVQEFRDKLRDRDARELAEEYVLSEDVAHVDTAGIDRIRLTIGRAFATPEERVKLYIVGSAKLGFSLVEKRNNDGTLSRYRPFSPTSDVDVAVLSPRIFDMIWHEISRYARQTGQHPWDSEKFGDYLVCGWLRLDKLPKNLRLRHCDVWGDCFNRLSSDRALGPRKIRGGLFYSSEHMLQYYQTTIEECKRAEDMNP